MTISSPLEIGSPVCPSRGQSSPRTNNGWSNWYEPDLGVEVIVFAIHVEETVDLLGPLDHLIKVGVVAFRPTAAAAGIGRSGASRRVLATRFSLPASAPAPKGRNSSSESMAQNAHAAKDRFMVSLLSLSTRSLLPARDALRRSSPPNRQSFTLILTEIHRRLKSSHRRFQVSSSAQSSQSTRPNQVAPREARSHLFSGRLAS